MAEQARAMNARVTFPTIHDDLQSLNNRLTEVEAVLIKVITTVGLDNPLEPKNPALKEITKENILNSFNNQLRSAHSRVGSIESILASLTEVI